VNEFGNVLIRDRDVMHVVGRTEEWKRNRVGGMRDLCGEGKMGEGRRKEEEREWEKGEQTIREI
jgi:hypothetical protein